MACLVGLMAWRTFRSTQILCVSLFYQISSSILIIFTHLGLLQFVELYQRGWSRKELEGLASANLLRVMQGAERVARELAREGAQPEYELYDRRTDIPVHPDL